MDNFRLAETYMRRLFEIFTLGMLDLLSLIFLLLIEIEWVTMQNMFKP